VDYQEQDVGLVQAMSADTLQRLTPDRSYAVVETRMKKRLPVNLSVMGLDKA
jgi:hypothetical protein